MANTCTYSFTHGSTGTVFNGYFNPCYARQYAWVVMQDYVKTAKAKGLSEGRIVWSHQIRNALIPVLTMLGPMVTSVLMGTFVIEKIFAIPGLGQHFVNSITGLDYTMTMGLTIFYGTFLVFANFLVDIAYGIVDPRIRITK